MPANELEDTGRFRPAIATSTFSAEYAKNTIRIGHPDPDLPSLNRGSEDADIWIFFPTIWFRNHLVSGGHNVNTPKMDCR